MSLSHLDVREHLVAALRYDLIGPMREDELLELRPTRWYLTGFLVPKGGSESLMSEILEAEELASGSGSDADDEASGQDQGPATPAWFPSSCGLTVLVPAGATELLAQVRWGEYSRLEGEETAALWHQHQPARAAELEKPRGALDGEEAEGEAEPKLRALPRLWKRLSCSAQDTVALRSRRWALPGSRGLALQAQVRPARAPGLPPGTLALSLFVVNDRDTVSGPALDERVIFQVELTLRCEAGFVPRADLSDLRSDDPDLSRADLQYRERGEWAVGHGVSAEVCQRQGEQVTAVRTAWLPEARVQRMKAGAEAGVSLGMETLAPLDGPGIAEAVGPLVSAYTAWITERLGELEPLNPERKATAERLLGAAQEARDRVAEGLALLQRDPTALLAFQLTNQAMAMAARRARPDDEPRWRLFQLAFLLLNLPSLFDPDHRHREVVELLFFPTGGGKTEAYLGVAAFAMLLRRLRGRERPDQGAGVAVLLRYTLRLLTLDQLGRAATLICALEVMRRQDPRLGGLSFSIGLWVGRSGTDNQMAEAEKRLSLYKGRARYGSPGVPLLRCPWCNAEFEPDCFSIEKRDAKPMALRVGCIDPDCPFHFDNSLDIGVPVAVVDEQVYRELPTFMLATVDKFATLPWRGAAGALFGRVVARDGQDFYTLCERPPKGAVRLPDGLPPPELIVQDELHLINGPLGTMVGLYETVIDALSRDSAGRAPKIVASTATARQAQRQIQAIFGRAYTEIFPPPGLTPDDTFFSSADARPEASRLYVGVAAPGRSPKAIAVRVFSTLLSAAYKDWKAANGGGLGNPADTYCTLVAYFNTLRELGGAQRLVQEEVAPRAERLHERRALQDSVNPWCLRRLLASEVLELTSRQSTEQIRQASGQLREPYASASGGRNDVLLASSMISVGVDIPRLGLMVMNGQPRTVAEYIQATSRVGRNTPGLVITVHNMRRPRDRSHFERFTAFHEGFYRMVEAASVTPFSSRAIDRGLAGVVVALTRHLWPLLTPPKGVTLLDRVAEAPEQVAERLVARLRAHAREVPPLLEAQLRQRVAALFSDWSEIAYTLREEGVQLNYSSWELAGGKPLLSTVVDSIEGRPERMARFRAPTSMRDVEPGVHLWVENGLGGGGR